MTRDELLSKALKSLREIDDYPADSETTHVIAHGLHAIACILLAREMLDADWPKPIEDYREEVWKRLGVFPR